jgi:F-type H+-transporting ATPase subunit beta
LTWCCPFAKGGKVGLFGGLAMSKTIEHDGTLTTSPAHSGLVRVRWCGWAYPLKAMTSPRDGELGVVNLENLKSKVAMVYGQMNEPPGNRCI